MPSNAVVERYRQAYPADPRGDEELTLFLGDLARSHNDTSLESDQDFRTQYLDLKMMLAPSVPQGFVNQVSSGIDRVQAGIYDTTALLGRALQERNPLASGPLGAIADVVTGGRIGDKLREFGTEGRERNLAQAAENPAVIQDVADVRNVGEAIRYGTELVGQQAPQLAGSVGAALVGGFMAGAPGAALGAYSFSFSQNQIHGELERQLGSGDTVATAIGVGSISALLDSIVPLKVGNQILKKVAPKEAGEYIKKVLVHTPLNAITEGGTETLQEVVAMAGEMYANRDNKSFSLSPETIRKRLVNSAVAGVLLGGATGPIEALTGQPQYKGSPPPVMWQQEPPPVVIPTADLVNGTQAGQAGYFHVDQDMVDQLAQLAKRELNGELMQVEKDALLRRPEMVIAYDAVLNNILDQIQAQQREVLDATATGQVQEGGKQKRVRVNALIPAEGKDRVVPAKVRQEGQVPGTGDSVQQVAQNVTDQSVEALMRGAKSESELIGIMRSVEGNKWEFSLQRLTQLRQLFQDKKNQLSGSPVEVITGDTLIVNGPPGVTIQVPRIPLSPVPPEAVEVEVVQTPTPLEQQEFVPRPEDAARHQMWVDAVFGPGADKPTIDIEPASNLRTKAIEASIEKRVQAQRSPVRLLPAPAVPEPSVAPPPKISTATTPEQPFDQAQFVDTIEWEDTFGNKGRPFAYDLPANDIRVRDRLERVLTRGSRDEGASTPKTFARRVTFFRNADTGQIIGLGTYSDSAGRKKEGTSEGSAGDRAYVANPVPSATGKKTKGIPMFKLLAKFRKENVREPLWQPVASVRLKNALPDLRIELSERQWQALLKDLHLRWSVEETRRSGIVKYQEAAAPPSATKTTAVEPGSQEDTGAKPIAQEEIPVDEEKPVAEEALPPEAPETGLTPDQIKTLWTIVVSGKNKTLETVLSENVDSLRDIAKQYRGRITGLYRDLGKPGVINAKSYEEFYAAFDPTGYRVSQLTAGTGANPDVGRSKPLEGDGGIHFTIPDGAVAQLLPEGEVKGRFNVVLQALREMGVGIEFGRALLREAGGYSNSQRLVTLVLYDALNPSVGSLRIAMHEAAHALFDKMPTDVQVQIRNAINAMSDDVLLLSGSPDKRIRRDNPKGLEPDLLAEERLAEWLALQGMAKQPAANVASNIIRLIKDLLFRAALLMQRLFGRNPSPALARAYARNRFNQMIAAGVNSKSLPSTIITPIPTAILAAQMDPVDQGVPMERINIDDSRVIDYPMMVPDSLSAQDFNTKFTETWTEYRFRGGPAIKSGSGALDSMMSMDRTHVRGNPRSSDWTGAKTPAEVQESIGLGNSVFDDELRSKGLMKFTFGEGLGSRQNPKVIAETTIAAQNQHKEVLADIARQLAGIPDVVNQASDAGLTPIEWFMSEFGIDNPQLLIDNELKKLDPKTKKPIDSNPDQAVDDFGDVVNRDKAARLAYLVLNKMANRLGTTNEKAKQRLEVAESERNEAAKDLNDSFREYLNIEGLTKLMSQQATITLRRLFRDLNRESVQLGAVAQQLRALDPETRPDVYLREFRSLVARSGLWRQMMNLLDTISTDGAIDLNAPISAIRDAMLPNPKYGALTQPTTESRALLATLVAYAKTNPRLMALLNLRRLQDTARRTAINADVQKLLRQGLSVADRMSRLTKVAVLEDKLKRAFDKDRRKVESLQRSKERYERRIAASDVAAKLYADRANKLAGKFELHAPFIFADGAKYWVPPNATATQEETIKNQKSLRLDSNLGPVDTAAIQNDIGLMNEWLDNRERVGQTDGFYYTILAQRDEIVNNGVIRSAVINTNYTVTGLVFSDAATQAKAFGTPAARLFAQMVNRFTGVLRALQPESERLGRMTERARGEAVKVLAEGRKMGASLENYFVMFYSPAVDFLEHARDVLELAPGNVDRQWTMALSQFMGQLDPARKELIRGKEMRFASALRKHIEAEWKASKFYEEKIADEGVGVTDDALSVPSPEGRVAGVRKRIGEGIITIPRTISKLFGTAYQALISNNWAKFSDELNEARQEGETIDKLGERFQEMFDNDDIRNYFFGAIALYKDTESAFMAPTMTDGITKPEAVPSYVAEAYLKSQGNIASFISLMYELHDGQSGSQTVDEYAYDVLGVFGSYFNEMNRVWNKMNPEFHDPNPQWSTMIPGFMVNSRKIQHWPSIWTQHLMFDRRTNSRVSARVAAEVSFGVEQERLAKAYETMLKESDNGLVRLDNALARVSAEVVASDKKVIEAALEKEVGGKEELKRLRKLRRMMRFLQGTRSIRSQLTDYFRGMDSPVRPIRLGQQMVGLFSRLMINQPGSALGNLADVFSPMLTFGVSAPTIRSTLRNIGVVGIDGATGLVSPFGIQLGMWSRMEERFNELGMGDPMAVAKAKDLLLRETSPYDNTKYNSLVVGLRKVQEAQDITVGSSKRTQLRPVAPFNQTSIMVDRANVINTWQMVQDFVARGMEAYDAGIGASDDVLSKWTAEQWAKELEMGKMETNSFTRLHTLMLDDWGIDFFTLVRDGIANRAANNDILSDRTLQRLQGMALKEITSANNIATMPLAAFNSSLIKFISPLLGWPYRRALRVADSWKDADGRASYAAVANMMLALAVVGAGGLAVSMLVDLYNEEALRKRRNLRRLTFDDPKNAALAIIEHTARVGTLGLWGDILNETANVGTGEGANRGVSLDQRIVFVSSILGLMRSVQNLVNQDFQVDYSGVVRPMVYSMGGNGAMQYMQIANNVFGPVVEAEAAATRRTNVGNWLRAAGRQLDMEVETARGGYGTPTPVTPFISRMVLAAYIDNPVEFEQAYRQAIYETRIARKVDYVEAEKYVRRAYSSRHPLRSTFRAAVGERDYHNLLQAMPDDGREDVSYAISMFNRYGDRIGVKPYSGAEDEDDKPDRLPSVRVQGFNIQALRSRAMGAALRL